MKPILAVLATFASAPAIAHTGHIETIAGHDHWIAIGAIGLAAAIGLIGLLKGGSDSEDDTEEQEA